VCQSISEYITGILKQFVAYCLPMKTLSVVCFAFALFLCSPCNGAEYVTLIVAGYVSGDVVATRYSETITLGAGDFAEMLADLQTFGDLEINLGAAPLVLLQGNYVPASPYRLAGPATIRLRSNSTAASPKIAVWSITRANSAANVIPANAVVIPEDAGGQYQVVLESSTDLLNWAVANPGTYGGSTPRRFFRTRIVKLN
jgi:hypothetical protein